MLPVGLLRQFGSLATSITIATRCRLSQLRRLIDTIDSISVSISMHDSNWVTQNGALLLNDADFEILPTRERPLQNTNK